MKTTNIEIECKDGTVCKMQILGDHDPEAEVAKWQECVRNLPAALGGGLVVKSWKVAGAKTK